MNRMTKCFLFFILGCILRIVVGFASYNSRISKISKEDDELYKNLAKCESIIIEKGDVECYDTLYRITEKNDDGCGIITLRKQILPSIIMANKFHYGKACKNVLYQTTMSSYSMNLNEKIHARELYALDWGLFFVKNGISFKYIDCLYNYASLLQTGYFSKEDSILGREVFDLLYNNNDSIDIWKEYRKLQNS